SIMYFAMRALIDPEGLRYSSLTHIPSTMTRGVSPIASRIVPQRTAPGCRAAPAAPLLASRTGGCAPLEAFMLTPPYVLSAGRVYWPFFPAGRLQTRPCRPAGTAT